MSSNPLYVFKNGTRILALKPIQCLICKNIFQPKVSKAKYCARNCYYKMKRLRKDRVLWTDKMRENLSKKYKGKKNPMYGRECWNKGKKRPEISGEKHPNYKGGWMQNGYWFISVEGRTVGQHTHKIESKIGRRITKNEVVHHINENKLDNRLSNLQLMTRSEHLNYHRKKYKIMWKKLYE